MPTPSQAVHNPPAPTPRALGSWLPCENPYDLPRWPGIYRFQSKRKGRWRTRYIGKASNLRTRVTHHEKLRGGDSIEYKRVTYPQVKFYDPVQNDKRDRLNIAEKLHFYDELKRGQQCGRAKDLRNWVNDYGKLSKSKQKITLVNKSSSDSSISRQRKQRPSKVDFCKYRPRPNSPRCGYHKRRHGSEYSNVNRCGYIRNN